MKCAVWGLMLNFDHKCWFFIINANFSAILLVVEHKCSTRWLFHSTVLRAKFNILSIKYNRFYDFPTRTGNLFCEVMFYNLKFYNFFLQYSKNYSLCLSIFTNTFSNAFIIIGLGAPPHTHHMPNPTWLSHFSRQKLPMSV